MFLYLYQYLLGLLLLRSEWAGPSGDESSEGEDNYAQQRFVDDDQKECYSELRYKVINN